MAYSIEQILGAHSAPARYLQWLAEKAEDRTAEQDADAPFLSVLMRTQGKRYEMLKEALLSLEAQTDQDFEVILVVHKPTEEDFEATVALLDALTPTFGKKVRHFRLDTGTRSSPLNLALSHAKGRYIAMLDDDDLVLENWVEVFHECARKNDGSVIRCYGLTQFWSCYTNERGQTVLQSDEAPVPTYCTPFRMHEHLEDNHTPISCVAIPRACYSVFGIGFDEALSTAEDWDFLMQCASLCGVTDTREITFLYRLWKNAETSHTVHREKEWLQNRDYIADKLSRLPYITAGKGKWPVTEDGEENEIVLKPSFKDRLKNAIRTHGLWRLPFLVLRKIFFRLFR